MLYRRENIYDLNDILESEKFVSLYKNIKHLQQRNKVNQKKKKKYEKHNIFIENSNFQRVKFWKQDKQLLLFWSICARVNSILTAKLHTNKVIL